MLPLWMMSSMMMLGSRTAFRRLGTATANTRAPLVRVMASSSVTRRLQIARAASQRAPSADEENVHERQTTLPKKTSVGIFVDLDNAAPREHTRETLSRFVKALRHFGKETIHGKVVHLQGWGNSATTTFGGEIEEVATANIFQPWDGQSAVSGFDEATATLRCGVCGRKIVLTKKDRQRKGMTVERKLAKHMKDLHAREQTKRLNNMKRRKGKLSEKDRERVEKFKSAAVGVMKPKVSNNLFQILKEQGMQCRQVDDADGALIKAATKWMKDVKSRNNNNVNATTASTTTQEKTVDAALVIVSQDSDFRPTLKNARKHGILAVSVSANSVHQTKALVQVSDIVLEAARSSSQDSGGNNVNDDLYDENHVSLVDNNDDDDDYANAYPISAVFKVTSHTDRGDAALQRGYAKKLSDTWEKSPDNQAE